jgi:hypothetical protein
VLWAILSTSMVLALILVEYSPKWAFYLLPTRAWEICLGGLCAFYLSRISPYFTHRKADVLSSLGLILILAAVFGFDKTIQSPGLWILLPTLGTVLVLIFCRPGSLAFWVLGNRGLVFIGLMSYSLYLWHQPVFAYLRISSLEPPSPVSFGILLPFVFLFAYLSWKFIETPFRRKSFMSSGSVFALSGVGAVAFVLMGIWLNSNYGMAWRVFDRDVAVADMDKRLYNERVFRYKKSEWGNKSALKILIIGNSFARDFVNITLETFDIGRVEIVYRDDLDQCSFQEVQGGGAAVLFRDADVIVFASGELKDCSVDNVKYGKSKGKKVFYVGTKDFGYNLNWILRLPKEARRGLFNVIPDSVIAADHAMFMAFPEEHYISLLKPVLNGGRIPITDGQGRMLSTDRAHLTKYGAIFFGRASVAQTKYAEIFK